MNIYVKIFLIAVLCFALMFGSGMYAFDKYYVDNSEDLTEEKIIGLTMDENEIEEESDSEEAEVEVVEKKSKLDLLIEDSNRLNILVFGTDGGRADTIFLVSYDPDEDLADIVSVPRDTYHKVEGFDAQGQYKINAVYGFKDVGGSKGMKYFLSEFLDVPIDHYVRVNYNGVAAIVDVIGGVETNVPFDMKYDDPWSDPPLHIDIKKGVQTLNGKKSVEYLRWRKNNGEEGTGDLNRISRQQDFLKRAIDKAIGLKLPRVIKTSLNYVGTDMPASDMLNTAAQASNFKMSNLKTYRIPGRASTDGRGLYIHDPEDMEKMFEEIYSRSNE
jgi:LCP family protein required for cell wall assembly